MPKPTKRLGCLLQLVGAACLIPAVLTLASGHLPPRTAMPLGIVLAILVAGIIGGILVVLGGHGRQ